jgi:ribonuclease P protein component
MSNFRFYKQAKLTKTDEFSSVFNFRRRLSSEFIVMHFKPNVLNQPRLGLVVSKKIAKSAVSRNYMRRVLREMFRTNQVLINPCDLIIRVQKKFNPLDFKQLESEFEKLILKLNSQLLKTSGLNANL